MKSFAMLKTSPIEPAQGEDRFFIDGTRVDEREYKKLVDHCARQDTFSTYRFARRWHHRSVCYR